MAEDPIKLFATRAERYPEPTDADLAQGVARAALAAIPIVGGSIQAQTVQEVRARNRE
jgi:hypothetical protein